MNTAKIFIALAVVFLITTGLFAALYEQNNTVISSLNQSTQSLNGAISSQQTSESSSISVLMAKMARIQSNLTVYIHMNANLTSQITSLNSTIMSQSQTISEDRSTISSQSSIINMEANITLLPVSQYSIPPNYEFSSFNIPYDGIVVFSMGYTPQGQTNSQTMPITANESEPLNSFYLTTPTETPISIPGVYVGYFPVSPGTVYLDLTGAPPGTLVITALLLY